MVLLEKKRYDKDIVDGINDLRNMDGEKALNNFELAKNLEKNYAFKKDSTLDSLIVASAEPYLLNYIETGCVKTWGNELDKARAIEDSAKKLQIKYALLTDSVIINALVDLKTKIFNRQCSNARDDFEEYYRDARRSVSQKNFAEADLYFAKCLKIASDNNNCSINDSVVVNDKAKYLSATTYQKMLRQTDSLEKLAKYRDAIDKYIKCSAYYSSHDIKAFGLVNVSLKDFLSAKANNDYLMESANYYFDQADYKNSVCFLEILRKNNYAPANTAAFQQKLATKLAIVDFAKDPKQKPTTLIKNYTIGNPWYVSFKKAYSGKWKELKKKQKSGGKESWFKHLLHNVTSKFGK